MLLLSGLLTLSFADTTSFGDFVVGTYAPKKQCSEILTCNKATIQWSTANNRFEYFQKCTANQSDFTERIDRLTVASYAAATIVGENLDECVNGGLNAVKKSYRKSYSKFYSPRKSKFESGPRFKFSEFDGDVFLYKGTYDVDGGYMPGELCSEFVPRIENGKPSRNRGYEPTTTVFHLHCGNRTKFKNGCDATAKVVPIKMKSAKNSTLSKKLAVYKEPESQISEIMYHVEHGCQIKEAIPFSSLYVEWGVSDVNNSLVFADRVLKQMNTNQQFIKDTFVQEDVEALKQKSVTSQQLRVPFSMVTKRLEYAVDRKQKIERCSIQVQGAQDKIENLEPLDSRRQDLQANTLEKEEQVEAYLVQVEAIFVKRKETLADELVQHRYAVTRDIEQARNKIEFLNLRLQYYQNKQQKLEWRTETLNSVFAKKKERLSEETVQQSGSKSQSPPAAEQSTERKNDYSEQISIVENHISNLEQYVKRRKTVAQRLTQTHEQMLQILDGNLEEHKAKVKRIKEKWTSIMAQNGQIQVPSVSTVSAYENRTSELKRCEKDHTSLTRYHKNYRILLEKLEGLEEQYTKMEEGQSSLVSSETLEEQIKTGRSFEENFKKVNASSGRDVLLNEPLTISNWSKKLELSWKFFSTRQRIQTSIDQWTNKEPEKSSGTPE